MSLEVFTFEGVVEPTLESIYSEIDFIYKIMSQNNFVLLKQQDRSMKILNTGQGEYTIVTHKFIDINERPYALLDTVITINHSLTNDMDPEYRITLLRKGGEHDQSSRSQRVSTILSFNDIDKPIYPEYEGYDVFITETVFQPIADFLSKYARSIN
jgi:hypothetical protein